MDVTLGLLAHIPACDDGGGGSSGVTSGASTTASEVTSSYPIVDGSLDDLELGLGLSIGAGSGGLRSTAVATCGWSQHARILTAIDLPTSLVSKPNPCSPFSSLNIPNSLISSGTKRAATDSVSPPNGTSVVGWPPVSKAHRIPSLANQIKSPAENFTTKPEQNKSKNQTIRIKDYSDERKGIFNTKYRSVKINMDGTLIGRKVDLNAHTSYEMLAKTLQEMFFSEWLSSEAVKPSRLLDGTSEFVLTYEDKDGDCMLVGDVPWQMFLSSVKRLRIMKNSDCNELARQHKDFKKTMRDT